MNHRKKHLEGISGESRWSIWLRLVIVFIGILSYEPFIFRSQFEPGQYVPVWICVALALLPFISWVRLQLHLCALFAVAASWYLVYRYTSSPLLFKPFIAELFIVIYAIEFIAIIADGVVTGAAIHAWRMIVLLAALCTMLSAIAYNAHILPYSGRDYGGYVAYVHPILGLVNAGPLFGRPSLWFAEPSYLGYFLGLNCIFIWYAAPHKTRVAESILVALAGVMVGSLTYWIVFAVTLVAAIIFSLVKMAVKVQLCIIVPLFIISIFLALYRTEIADQVSDKVGASSYGERRTKLSISKELWGSLSLTDKIFGAGSGYIISRSEIGGESNAYVKLLVEQGVIVLTFALLWLFFMLYRAPPALIFTLLGLHSVVLIATPWFIVNVMLLASVMKSARNSGRVWGRISGPQIRPKAISRGRS